MQIDVGKQFEVLDLFDSATRHIVQPAGALVIATEIPCAIGVGIFDSLKINLPADSEKVDAHIRLGQGSVVNEPQKRMVTFATSDVAAL